MVRYRIEPYRGKPGFVSISAGRFTVIVTSEVAQRFERLVRRARPRGWWQLRLLLELAEYGRVKAKAAYWVGGRAVAYAGSYQRSLDAIMERAGARYVPGPRGGEWSAYYELVGDGE